MKIVGVTSCPSGVAHTYMAAESLRLAGADLGIEVKMETQGADGIENRLRAEDIEDAVCVILSSDTMIRGEQRFKGKKILRMRCSDLIEKSEPLMMKLKITFE